MLTYGVRGDLEYRAIASLVVARAHSEAGDVREAVEEYDRFLRLWSGADQELQGWVVQARHDMQRLIAEPST